MRTSFIWLVVGAAMACACVVGSAGARFAAAQEASEAAAPATVSAETLKDVEIMRRVLQREGLGASVATGVVYGVRGTATDSNLWYPAASDVSDAFVVPGQGVTFLLRTSDAVAPPKDVAGEGGEDHKPTAWDEEAAAVEGRPIAPPTRTIDRRYEAAKVEALQTRLLEQLRNYGSKIRGLAPSESLTVIVEGGSGARFATVARPAAQGGVNDAAAALLRYSVATTLTNGPRTVLVIRVSVADCREGVSADEFKRRARVTAY